MSDRGVAVTDFFDYHTWMAHVVSLGTIFGSAFGYLPQVAAVIGLAYYLLQIYGDKTVQGWIIGWQVRKLARLRAARLKQINLLKTELAAVEAENAALTTAETLKDKGI